ncbi:hypothetical protein PAPHI01_2208 [Pancytospora philotis]|nr:hypothetical protein PAPHI01_2208 [Pancytospora philotis]
MAEFAEVRLEMCLPVSPKFLNEPFACVFGQVSRQLLRYSAVLGGVPLSFTINGVMPHCQIGSAGEIYVDTLISFCVLRLEPGASIPVSDGLYMSTFPCRVDENDSYTGEMEIQQITPPMKICGTESFRNYL